MDIDPTLIARSACISDLPDDVKRLWDAAQPVIGADGFGSGFFVGCSAIARREVFHGFNSELKGYNEAVHAEEAMISNLRSVHFKEGLSVLSPLEVVLVTAKCDAPISPCGSCRDWLVSYAKSRDTPVYLSNTSGEVIPVTLRLLLPDADDLLRCGRAREVPGDDPMISYARESAAKAGVGAKIWSEDVSRYASVMSDSHKVYRGLTVPQSAYHGHSAVVSAVASFLCDSQSHPTRIKGACLVVAGGTPTLPLGCERQWLFELSSAQGRMIDVTVIPMEGTPVRTNARSMLPYAFSADKVKSYLKGILLGKEL